MRAGVIGAVIAATLGACGGAGAGAPRAAGPRLGADSGTALSLYRDGALVRQRLPVVVGAGRTEVALALPSDVGPEAVHARVDGDGVALVALVARPVELRPGDAVELPRGDGALAGTLRWVGPREVVVETAERMHLVESPAHLRQPGAAGAGGVVAVIDAARPGRAVVELVYPTRELTWTADYALVLDTRRGDVELRGSLGIDNAAGLTFDAARITLLDAARPTRLALGGAAEAGAAPPPVVDPTKPRAEQPPAPRPEPPRTPQVTLPYAVDVTPGAQAVSLLAGALRLPARQALVYDAVGDGLDLAGRVPTMARDYGVKRGSPRVSQSIDVELSKAALPEGLPAGTARLAERAADGTLLPLGEARIFERADAGADRIAPTMSVAVGSSGYVSGRRTRREFSVDADAQRLVEEFAIDLTSTADAPQEVVVREHLYRGLNWTLGYHNAVGGVVKEGPQKIALRTVVPARGSARVVYRIVYHWAR